MTKILIREWGLKIFFSLLVLLLAGCYISGVSTTRGKIKVRIMPIPVVTIQPHIVPNEASLLPTVTPEVAR